MWFDNFSKGNCKNCYACVRVCPVNAIEIKNEQARIIEERCIVCEECSLACPQKHKIISSEVPIVKHYLRNKEKVVASIAPSFAAIFGKNSHKIPTVLKHLGFSYVEETLVGAQPIIDEYFKYINKDDDENYITTLCPTIVNLIEKHYPDLIPNLIPSISAFICHGKIIKEKYGSDTKVVFIGPCLGKKDEGRFEDCIDAVVTLEEFERWLKQENICWDNFEETSFDAISHYKKVYPFISENTGYLSKDKNKKEVVSVDGAEDCLKTINAIRDKRISNAVFEMNFCNNGCIRGTGMGDDGVSSYERRRNIIEYSENCNAKQGDETDNSYDEILPNIDLHKEFQSKYVPLKEPSDKELKDILKSMGKFARMDEINCKACGYKTCRDKAKAVFNGLADTSMCIPYMRQKAENRANVIFSVTPNLIGIIDKDLCVEEFNPAAQKFFSISSLEAKGMPVIMYLDEDKFQQVRDNRKSLIKDKIEVDEYNSVIIQNIIWLEEDQIYIWIANNVTKEENKKKEIQQMKMDTVNMTQDVINKQMLVAQEIASLLGETTAETKVTLTKLKKLVEEEGKNNEVLY
ncbi:MAG: [Fe-Fe] hydrogenase large subunit C-terminal domain-containing protein [Terrisporobacter sp.]|uniref:[Fe-Fe] hydrogenase large subunit C-terminal domain-containing protein n=1 Tax=Terrisporobacter sp. TaxID=1965305 RepID=UPI002FC59E9C